jgi:hypothetical protein
MDVDVIPPRFEYNEFLYVAYRKHDMIKVLCKCYFSPCKNIYYSIIPMQPPHLMYTSTVVNLSHVNHLLAPRTRNLVGQFLSRQRLPRRLDDVHLVAGAGCLCSEILQAGGAREFEDEMLGAETEAFLSQISH